MGRRVATGIATMAMVAAAGIGGFLIGRARNSDQPSPASIQTARSTAERDGYNRGYGAGRVDGTIAGEKTGESDGYGRGHQAGLRQADRVIQKAVDGAFNAGAKSVFDGFGSPWLPGSWYVVKVTSGSAGIPYELATRLQMDPSSYYNVCPSTGDICGDTWADLFNNLGAAGTGSATPPDVTPVTPPDTAPPNLGNLGPTNPVVCGDGTISDSGGHSGACSHHGGEL
jgi:hypothetical protein